MRLRLMTAAALGPLYLLAVHAPAYAQSTTTINSSTTNPVSTNGNNVDVASGGTVGPTSGTGVTINSNNTVTVEGAIAINNADNAIGILANPGVTSSISLTGTIGLGDNYTPATNSDGYSQAPYASGTGRYGIETQGAFSGPILSAGTITVQGNESYGIAILGGLQGGTATPGNVTGGATMLQTGTVSLTGDHGYGVYTAGEITGNVQVNGTITVQGAGSVGVATTGQIDGALQVYSTVTDTGYASTTRPTTTEELNLVQGTAAQVEQGGQAIWVQGSVLGGVFLAAPPAGTTTSTTADLDGDGVEDGGEGTASLITYSSAPALQIGGPSAITLGEFGSCNGGGPGDNCFGLIIEGSVSAQGIYDGVVATAIDIGANGTPIGTASYNGVNIEGGIRIAGTGTVTADAYSAQAVAIQLDSGVTTPVIQNEGTITSSVTSSGPDNAYGVLIQPGASVSTINNFGSVEVSVTGDYGSAYGIVDKSGTVSTFENSGTISTTLTPTALGDTLNGSTVAVDLSANTTGVNFTQLSLDSSTPTLIGDVLLSQTGPNNVQILAGTVTGALSLGNASGSSLLIDNGSVYKGALTYTGTGLSINVNNGTLQDTTATVITGPTLTVGASGKLVVTLDPALSTGTQPNTRFNVGTASFANGATLGATFLSTPTSGEAFTIVKAGSLTVGSTSLQVTTPFLFNASTQVNTSTGAITLTVTPKTAAELGLNKAETAIYPALYAALGQDAGIQNALLNAPASNTFHADYKLMLPDSAGDVFQVIQAMSKSIARADLDAAGFVGSGSVAAQDGDEVQSNGGLWASEYIVGLNQVRQDNEAYRADGLGLIGGLDFGGWGADVSFGSANVVKPNDPGDSIVSISRLEAGLYAAPTFGILHTEMRVDGAFLRIGERREFAAAVTTGDLSTTTTISRTANATWTGYDFGGRLGAGLQLDMTRHFFLQPQVHMDFQDTHEGAYTESGGGPGFDMAVNARDSSEGSLTAGVVAGLHYGSTFVFKPQVELGWDDVLAGGPGNTTARFAYGGSTFVLPPDSLEGGAGVMRLQLKGDGEYVHFSVEAGGEFRSDYEEGDVRAAFRVSY